MPIVNWVSYSCTCIASPHQDNVMVEEVKLRRKYLNSGDVFILDLGLELYQVRLATSVCVYRTQQPPSDCFTALIELSYG